MPKIIKVVPKTENKDNDLPVGLAAPAQRALAAAAVENLQQLSQFSESEIRKWHGIGPKALAQLQKALNARGLEFAAEK